MTYSDFYKLYYEPYATDAALQKRIADGIEQNRKGNCRVRVTNAVGKPLANTRVEIKQTAHAFRYGANIFMLDEFGRDDYNAEYRRIFKEYFNAVTVPFFWKDNEHEEGHHRFAKNSPPSPAALPPISVWSIAGRTASAPSSIVWSTTNGLPIGRRDSPCPS